MSPVPPITTIFIVISVTPTNACRSHQSLVSLRWNVRSIVTRSMDLFKPDEVVLKHALDAPIQDQRGRGYGDKSGTSASGFEGNEDHHSAISRGGKGQLAPCIDLTAYTEFRVFPNNCQRILSECGTTSLMCECGSNRSIRRPNRASCRSLARFNIALQ